MFERDGDTSRRACCWRYTATMREAAKRGLTSKDIAAWLSENGGINALFRARPVETRSNKTKTLHLNQQVEMVKGEATTITLLLGENGFCDVVNVQVYQEAAE